MASLTWVDDGTPSLEGEFADVSPVDSYVVELRRNGGDWVEVPASPITDDNSASYSFSVQRGAGNVLARAARVDGYYEMRVSESGDGTVYWTGDTYSPPAAPVSPGISRPDGDTVSISWTTESEAAAAGPAGMAVDVQVAEVDSGGVGPWQFVRRAFRGDMTTGNPSTVGSTLGVEIAVGGSYDAVQETTLSRESRYRVRIRHVIFDGEGPKASQWVYADYGTADSHVESDNFVTGNLVSWGNQSTTPNDSGVISGAPPRARAHLPSGAETGGYYWFGNDGAVLHQYIGDLSSKSGTYVIQLRAAVASQTETVTVEWKYSGSWTQIYEFGAEHNAVGWETHHIPVPDDQHGQWNAFRIICGSNTFDFGLLDRMTFADMSEEFTRPATPTGLEASATETELSATWDALSSYPTRLDFQNRESGASWSTTTNIGTDSTSHTESFSVNSGTLYEVRIQSRRSQFRHGEFGQFFNAFSPVAETGYLPPPRDIVVTDKTATTVSIAWTPANAGEDEQLIYHSRDGGESYTIVGSVTPSETTYQDTELLNGERYTFTVAASTGWATSREDDGTVSDPGDGDGGGETAAPAGFTLGDSLGTNLSGGN